jgi:hypothetical protein
MNEFFKDDKELTATKIYILTQRNILFWWKKYIILVVEI